MLAEDADVTEYGQNFLISCKSPEQDMVILSSGIYAASIFRVGK
jgi:hypothetical protein